MIDFKLQTRELVLFTPESIEMLEYNQAKTVLAGYDFSYTSMRGSVSGKGADGQSVRAGGAYKNSSKFNVLHKTRQQNGTNNYGAAAAANQGVGSADEA